MIQNRHPAAPPRPSPIADINQSPLDAEPAHQLFHHIRAELIHLSANLPPHEQIPNALSHLASQLHLAIHTCDATTRDLLLQEREQLGQQLHDSLCQDLFALSAFIARLQRLINTLDSPDARNLIEQIAQLQLHTLTCARGLATGHLWPAIRPNQMPAALHRLARTTRRRFGVKITVRLDPAIRLTTDQANHLLFIARESVANAIQHAHASRLLIILSTIRRHIVLRVHSDGQPCQPHPKRHPGLGLWIMHHRAQLMAARLSLHVRPTGGTTLRCLLPQPPL
jgi:NarL family two-component system sensor histidine kinase LiaS